MQASDYIALLALVVSLGSLVLAPFYGAANSRRASLREIFRNDYADPIKSDMENILKRVVQGDDQEFEEIYDEVKEDITYINRHLNDMFLLFSEFFSRYDVFEEFYDVCNTEKYLNSITFEGYDRVLQCAGSDLKSLRVEVDSYSAKIKHYLALCDGRVMTIPTSSLIYLPDRRFNPDIILSNEINVEQ